MRDEKANYLIKSLHFVFLVLIFELLLSACTQIEKAKDVTLVKDAVMRYNKGLIEAAKTGNVESLKGMASDDVLRRLYHWIAAWEDSDLYMDATAKDIKFKNINIIGQTARVLTAEDWIYEYKSIKTKRVALPASGIYYEMEYILQKRDNKWVITAINIKSEKKKDRGTEHK
ncbi:MAG: hypothetical protein M1610_09675 [Nitrospirae bacterium]|nr:hypothetical protein [Nitrospirota bacterium]MDA8340325.1 hypothetical protein [Nitrospiraceae bacterium]